MKRLGITGMSALLALLMATPPLWAWQGKPHGGQDKADKQDKGKAKGRQERDAERQRANRQRQAQHQQQVAERQRANRQRLRIVEQRRTAIQYGRQLDGQQLRAQRYAARLQQQKRMANYRYHQEYLARMREQQLALQRTYDYDNDPYFSAVPTYRYRRGASYYEVNQYGADMLREAVNNGYAEGYRAGRADQQDRWASDYRSSYAYQDANDGYNGHNLRQADYNYYFREGFTKGYQDGYYSRSQYGQESNGSRSILGGILSQILNLQAL